MVNEHVEKGLVFQDVQTVLLHFVLPEVSFGLRVLSLPSSVCLCVVVCVCVNPILYAKSQHLFKLEPPNFDQKWEATWLRSRLFVCLFVCKFHYAWFIHQSKYRATGVKIVLRKESFVYLELFMVPVVSWFHPHILCFRFRPFNTVECKSEVLTLTGSDELWPYVILLPCYSFWVAPSVCLSITSFSAL